MRKILISIKPKWVKKILNGEKTERQYSMKHYKYKGKVYDEIEMFNKLIELEEIQEVPFITYRDRNDMVMGTENDDTATMVDEVIENTGLDIDEVKGDIV